MALSSTWDSYARRTPARRHGPPPAFSWTPHPGHGPGTKLLEVGRGAAVLELGCGKGDRLAALAALGVRPVGVDISAVQVAAAATRWGSTVEVHQADALHFLSHTSDYYDAVYSAFGAHWFTDPDVLLPAIRERLRPGGTLVLAHLPPGDRIEPDEPTVVRSTLAMVLRWEGEAHQWASLLRHHGFVAPSACAILPPHGARTERTVVLRSRVPARPPRTAQGTTTPAT